MKTLTRTLFACAIILSAPDIYSVIHTFLSDRSATLEIRAASSGNSFIGCSINTISVKNNAVGAIARKPGHVIGNLQQAVANGTNTCHHPVRIATGYSPASIAFSNVGTGGDLILKTCKIISANDLVLYRGNCFVVSDPTGQSRYYRQCNIILNGSKQAKSISV